MRCRLPWKIWGCSQAEGVGCRDHGQEDVEDGEGGAGTDEEREAPGESPSPLFSFLIAPLPASSPSSEAGSSPCSS